MPKGSHKATLAMTALLTVCATGCTLTNSAALVDGRTLQSVMPRELNKVILPEYQIEPPDILSIDAVSTIPKSPYRLNVLDLLVVQVVLPNGDRPIDGDYAVELDGTIRFGSPYDDPNENENPELRIQGPITIEGLTLDEATSAIRAHLRKTFRDPAIRVSIGEIAAQQQIAGEHLVAPDGTVNLGTYGRVRVTGLTVEQAKAAIESHLSHHLHNPAVSVDVFAYNSKVYYVILQGAGLGDRLLRVPITGNETALDAITEVEGLTGVSSTRMWISRPGGNACGGHQMLPIDWHAITQCGDVRTNYQILPGDRIFVAEDRLVAIDTHLGKLFSPIERILGTVLLGTSTAQRVDFYERTGGGTF